MSIVSKTSVDNGCLTIFLQGRVDSSNASEMETDVFAACSVSNFQSLKLDMAELSYISSAGLRVVLKLAKANKQFEVVNVTNEVYDVFEVTGFTNIVKVSKGMRSVSVEGCEMIGRGANGAVYRLDEDTIIKVYSNSTPVEVIRQEREFAQRAFLAGVPTAISFDMVKVDDSYGIVFELVRADTLAKRINTDQERYEWYATAYANLFKGIHQIEMEPGALPSTKDIYHGFVNKMGEKWYSAAECDTLHKLIDLIPDRNTIIHNDFHTQNVMLQNDELLLIDMAEISHGHPVFDLGASYFVHQFTSETKPQVVRYFLGIDALTAMNLWDKMVKKHFGTEDEDRIAHYNELIRHMCYLKVALMPVIFYSAGEDEQNNFVEVGRREVIAKPDEMAAAIKELVEIVDKSL